MDDIYNIKDQLLILNTIPVIVHGESDELYHKFISTNEKTQRFGELHHLDRKDFVKSFKLGHHPINLSEVAISLGNGIKELMRLKKLGYFLDKTYMTKGKNFI